MANFLGNSAKLGIGAIPTYLTSARNISFDPGQITLTPSNLLGESVDTFLTGSRTSASITVGVAVDKADTNGQAALNTAWKAGTDVAVTLAPEGPTAGCLKIMGHVKVESIGSLSFEKNSVVMRNITLKFNGDFIEGVFP